MDFIELPSPERRIELLPFRDLRLNITEILYLPPPSSTTEINFFSVLSSRTTRRDFGPIDLQQLSTLFWHSAKSKKVVHLEHGHKWYHRPAPSGGGRHPIDQIVFFNEDKQWSLFQYDPIAHALGKLQVDKPLVLQQWMDELFKKLEIQSKCFVWNIARFRRSTSVYLNASSLIYRDEGAIQATFGLVAEALGLNFCSIGVSGEPVLSQILNSAEFARGIGGFFIGSRPIPDEG